MVEYLNYTAANVTNMTGALQYSASVIDTATGFAIFFPLLLMAFFFGGLIVSNRYGFERSILFAGFFAMVCAALMVAAGVLEPIWLILAIIITGAAFALGW